MVAPLVTAGVGGATSAGTTAAGGLTLGSALPVLGGAAAITSLLGSAFSPNVYAPDRAGYWNDTYNKYANKINELYMQGKPGNASTIQALVQEFAKTSNHAGWGTPPAEMRNQLTNLSNTAIKQLQSIPQNNQNQGVPQQKTITEQLNDLGYEVFNNGAGNPTIATGANGTGQVAVSDIESGRVPISALSEISRNTNAPIGQASAPIQSTAQSPIPTQQGAKSAQSQEQSSSSSTGTTEGLSPEALIQQIIDSVGTGQTQQENTIKQQYAQLQPEIESAMQAALVKQGGGGRGALDTGGAISAIAQQKQKTGTDLNTALADVAKYYSGLKQQALGQALSGSLNLAQMAQQANQFGQGLSATAQQQATQNELQKFLANQQAQQQNKQLQAQIDQFSKTLGLQQQQFDYGKQSDSLNRQYQLQDYQTQANLAKELAGMQPQQPEYSYWLNPLASALGTYFGTKGVN